MDTNENNQLFKIDQSLSIMIPFVGRDKDLIGNIFQQLNIGIVESIEYIENKTNGIALVYMEKWNDSVVVEHLQEKIIDTEREARLVYNDPDYWILLPNPYFSDYYSRYHFGYIETQINNIDDHLSNFFKEQNNILDELAELKECMLRVREDNYKKGIEIGNLYKELNLKKELQNKFTNNSCCGAVSEGWAPSSPQKENTIISDNSKRRKTGRYNFRPRPASFSNQE